MHSPLDWQEVICIAVAPVAAGLQQFDTSTYLDFLCDLHALSCMSESFENLTYSSGDNPSLLDGSAMQHQQRLLCICGMM